MVAGADGDSRILGPAAAERPARLNKSTGSPGLFILLIRLCRKPRPYGLACQGQSFLSSLGFLLFCLCVEKTPPLAAYWLRELRCITVFFSQSPEKPSFLFKWLVSCGQCGDTE